MKFLKRLLQKKGIHRDDIRIVEVQVSFRYIEYYDDGGIRIGPLIAHTATGSGRVSHDPTDGEVLGLFNTALDNVREAERLSLEGRRGDIVVDTPGLAD